MPIDPAFFELMPSTITVERYTGDDQYGNNLYGAPVSVRCRIDSLVTSMAGGPTRSGTVHQPNTATIAIYADYTDPPYTPRDRVTLPDGRKPAIVSVDVHYDERGPYHQVINCEDTRE